MGFFPTGVWVHLAVTYGDGYFRVYKNGALAQEYANSSISASTVSTFAYQTEVLTGNASRCMHDVRIYDHVLSAREVRDVADGLCLHYKLDNPSDMGGNRNVKPYDQWFSTSAPGKTSGTFTRTIEDDPDAANGKRMCIECTAAPSSGGGPYLNGVGKSGNVGRVMTWSLWAKATKDSRMSFGDETGGIITVDVTTEWKKFTKTWTVQDTTYGAFILYSGWAVGMKLYIRDMKMEYGDIPTEWRPNIGDTFYKSLGYEHTGNPNLLKNIGKYPTIAQTMSKADGYQSYPVYANGLTVGNTYTLSCECDGNLASSHVGSSNPANKYWTIWLYQRSTAHTDSNYTGYDTPTVFHSQNYSYRKEGLRYVWTFTPTYPNVSLRLNLYSDGTTPLTITWKYIKLEAGGTATDWSPHQTDALYTSDGYDRRQKAIDQSGHGHDAELGG